MIHAYTRNARDVYPRTARDVYNRTDREKTKLAVSYFWIIVQYGILNRNFLYKTFKSKYNRKKSSLI